MATASGQAWVAVVPSSQGKAVKDILKSYGWLDGGLRPRAADGSLAFPLVAEAVEAVREAALVGAPPVMLAVTSVEEAAGLAAAKKAPPQRLKTPKVKLAKISLSKQASPRW